MSTETLKQAVVAALGQKPSAADRRAVADELERLAAEQRQIADATARQARKPAQERLAPRSPTAGPGRAPARWVRVERKHGRLVLYVGRGLYYDWQSPARMDVERRNGSVVLVANTAGQYSVVAPANHMPHMVVDGARDLIDLEDGRYQAEVRGAALVIGDAL